MSFAIAFVRDDNRNQNRNQSCYVEDDFSGPGLGFFTLVFLAITGSFIWLVVSAYSAHGNRMQILENAGIQVTEVSGYDMNVWAESCGKAIGVTLGERGSNPETNADLFFKLDDVSFNATPEAINAFVCEEK